MADTPGGEILVYEAPDGAVRVDVRLERGAIVAKTATTAADGKTYQAEFFNLDAMVALVLLIAESEPSQKELMIRLVLNLLEDDAP